jgi:hypothetical protein
VWQNVAAFENLVEKVLEDDLNKTVNEYLIEVAIPHVHSSEEYSFPYSYLRIKIKSLRCLCVLLVLFFLGRFACVAVAVVAV